MVYRYLALHHYHCYSCNMLKEDLDENPRALQEINKSKVIVHLSAANTPQFLFLHLTTFDDIVNNFDSFVIHMGHNIQ